MTMYLPVVTGNEGQTEQFSPQTLALIQFYHAFNHGKLDLMAQNWANHAHIVMNNPLGGIKLGWQQIKTVYQRIFEGEASVYVEFYDYKIQGDENTFFVTGRERGSLTIPGKEQLDLAIRTSRIYQRLDGRWQQVHHHGSIDKPELLSQYQQLTGGE